MGEGEALDKGLESFPLGAVMPAPHRLLLHRVSLVRSCFWAAVASSHGQKLQYCQAAWRGKHSMDLVAAEFAFPIHISSSCSQSNLQLPKPAAVWRAKCRARKDGTVWV